MVFHGISREDITVCVNNKDPAGAVVGLFNVQKGALLREGPKRKARLENKLSFPTFTLQISIEKHLIKIRNDRKWSKDVSIPMVFH